MTSKPNLNDDALQLSYVLDELSLELGWHECISDERHVTRPKPDGISPCVWAAIECVRHISWRIGEGLELAGKLPRHPAIQEAKEVLRLAAIVIRRVDEPATLAAHRGDGDGAIYCCQDAIRDAQNRCGDTMKSLAARLLVAATDGLPGAAVEDDSANEPPEWLIELSGVSGKFVRCLWNRRTRAASFDELRDEVWEGDYVVDDTIKSRVKRANMCIADYGFNLSISERRVKLESLRPEPNE